MIGVIWLCDKAMARTQIVEGGVSVDYHYVDRESEADPATDSTDDTTSTETSTQTSEETSEYAREIRISPVLVYRNQGERDGLEIHYRPSYSYDYELEAEDVDHELEVSVYRQMSRVWTVRATNTYVAADYQDIGTEEDSTTTETSTTTTSAESSSGSSDSNEFSQEKFWRNEFQISSQYSYLEDSVFSIGYSNTIMRHDEEIETSESDQEQETTPATAQRGRYQDIDVQSAYTTLSYRLNRRWKMSGVLNYTEGEYFPTIPIEIDEYNPDDGIVLLDHSVGEIRIDAEIWPRNPFFITYSYHRYEFDAYQRDDFVIEEMTIGWEGELTENLTVLLSGGPSLVEPDERDGEWGYNSEARLNYRFERGSFMISFQKGNEVDMLSSVDEETLTDFYVARSELRFQAHRDLFLILSGSYRGDLREVITLDDPETTDTDEADNEQYYEYQYSAGVRLNYSFWRYYTVSLGYRYTHFDSEQQGGDFEESRVYLTFEAEKELFRW